MSAARSTGIVLRIGELFLKGQNRYMFEQHLMNDVRRALKAFPRVVAERLHGRIWVASPGGGAIADIDRLVERLACVFGVATVSPVLEARPALDSLTAAALEIVRDQDVSRPTRFAVATNRADKRFPMKSPDISRAIAEACLEANSNLAVDLRAPELKVGVEIGPERSFVFAASREGAGGLPSGSGGRVVLLLSGGIDSPVAGYLVARRGALLSPVYFHSAPHTSEAAREKVIDLARVLAKYTGPIDVTVVPFTAVQEALRMKAPGRFLVVLYRRMMMRIATAIAERRRARGIVTGESLGQVASQTLDNIAAIEAVTAMPVLRPLIGADKVETIRLARKIGTYDISIRPYDDCCALFVPAHPETHARIVDVEAIEADFDVAGMVEAAVLAAETVHVDEGVESPFSS
ncbi:MAG: tRNA 4-thiouridine(8) synthase ThiI [Deltaproteobacteria bacterium]|nr:tRNA 4-thiouridine(8) synthase ThiI [Deltaproteobacteria bacterium]